MDPGVRGSIDLQSNCVYLAVWRWHFYARLLVVPFLLVLATSGLVMLLRRPIDAVRHRGWRGAPRLRSRLTTAGAAYGPEMIRPCML